MKFTESMLDQYSLPLSQTEDQQCKNAIGMVSDALKRLGFSDDNRAISLLYPDTYSYSTQLRNSGGTRQIKLFVQGSYANNTNVRSQSDVDIAVVQEEVFQTEYRYGATDEMYHFSNVPDAPKSFKDEVQECLEYRFGGDVERKNKSIQVHGNTYRKDADTVPSRRMRNYSKDYSNDPTNFIGGVFIMADDGQRIINYPEQHINNGRMKNTSTHGYYKKMVRIIKKMRYLMEDDHISAAMKVSSFVLESLLWNIADSWYLENCANYRKVYAFSLMISLLKVQKPQFRSYLEANGIKSLCPNEETNRNLCDFIDTLSDYYCYE